MQLGQGLFSAVDLDAALREALTSLESRYRSPMQNAEEKLSFLHKDAFQSFLRKKIRIVKFLLLQNLGCILIRARFPAAVRLVEFNTRSMML